MSFQFIQLMPATGWYSRHLYDWREHRSNPRVVYCPLVCWALAKEEDFQDPVVYGCIATYLEDIDDDLRNNEYYGDIYPAKRAASFNGFLREDEIEKEREGVQQYLESIRREPPISDAEAESRRKQFQVLSKDRPTEPS